MSETQKQESRNIIDIIDKGYQHRSPLQHKRVVQFLTPYFPTLTPKMIRLISFYVLKVPGPITLTTKEFPSQSLIIVGTYNDMDVENPECAHRMLNLTKDKKVNLQQNQFGLVLDYSNYISCQSLGQSSVQQQIQFMHTSQFLCSVPKKRLYHILKKADILKLTISNTVYNEGQKFQYGEYGSSAYLVRKGDLGYFKYSQKQSKQIQVLQFSKGHLFGTLELNNYDKDSEQAFISRSFTVKCKSSSVTLYRIPVQIYTNFIKPYCESLINNKQSKLFKYIDSHISHIKKVRSSNNPFLSQTIEKGFSKNLQNSSKLNSATSQLPLLKRTRLSLPQSDPVFVLSLESKKIEQQGLRKTNYLTLTKQGPLKAYPLISQRSNFTESEFKQYNKIERTKEKLQKMKSLTLKDRCPESKGQIMYSFFKQTWNFQKIKKQLAHKSHRYA